jgi:AraC-like DNA-binding protein
VTARRQSTNGSPGAIASPALPVLTVAAFAPRDAFRPWLRKAFPRRRVHFAFAATASDFEGIFRRELVDAACIDLDHGSDEMWQAAALAQDFPSVSFFGVTPWRGTDGPAIARCAAHAFADVLAQGVDDAVVRQIVLRHAFSARFARALETPPPSLRLRSDLQLRTWAAVVAHGGRPVRTEAVARAVGLTREHLSRRFASGGAPNLKRVIDLVRLLSAAELAKNPGHDVADVAAVLGFASPSHLSTAARRITGARPASLTRLRAVDLLRRFAQGRERSRG